MAAKKSSGTVRTRNYATVVYPESAPEHWQEKLAECCIPAFISPLHDSDANPDGEAKKEHYHVMLCFEGPKTRQQAADVFAVINGVGCEVVQSLRGYARYLCHLDNPEKHQYSPEDVVSLCGADYFAAVNLPTDKYKALREMMSYCKEHDVSAYADLLEYAAENRIDWFRVLCDNGTIVMKEYLKSRSWKFGDKRPKKAPAVK